MNFKYGWLSLINSTPACICDFISYSTLSQGANIAKGTVISNTEFNTPTGGTWVSSPISINSEPTITCLNPNSGEATIIVADSINMKIQMANLNAPPPLKGLVFLIGNPPGRFDYMNQIPINLGALNYTYCLVSLLENSVKPGNAYGNIPAVDFDRTLGPFTGVQNLNLMFSGYYGPIDLGIRIESTTNLSSIFGLKAIIMPPDYVLGNQGTYELEDEDVYKYLEKKKKAKPKLEYSDPTGSPVSGLTISGESNAHTPISTTYTIIHP